MLGKRPHQIQRSTSMSQLRAPPGARTRPPASPFAPAKAECASHDNNSSIASMKTAAPQNSQPHTLMEDAAQLLEKKIESPHDINLRSVDEWSPTVHAYMEYSQAKDPHLPLKAASSLPLIAKFTRKESFLDACFFCKRPLGHGRDIFMYRGDAAFCTEECRLRQISCDEKCSVSASHSATTDNTAGNPKSTRTTTPTGAF